MKFEYGLIISMGFLVAGIVYMASFDEQSEQSPYDAAIVNSLNNIEYGQFRDNDIHYEKVDREQKYYASMAAIKLLDNNSIQITFDVNYFKSDGNEEYIKSEPSLNSELVAIVKKHQTFVAGCNSFLTSDNLPTEKIPVKQLHVLKYLGITEKDGISYYGFVHEAGYVSDEVECKFPEIIQYSLNVDFDISETNFYGDVWDHDWN